MRIRKLPLAIFLVSAIAGCSLVSAQNTGDQERKADQPYSVASLNGEWALVGTYTNGIARQLGVVRFEDGDVTGFLRVNVQGATPTQRIVVYLSFKGTITVADDGTGIGTLSVTYPDGSLHPATLDMLITKAYERRNAKIATEIATMQRETPALSPGALIVATLTRRPD